MCKRIFKFELQLSSYTQNIKFSRYCPKFHIFTNIVIFQVYLQLFRTTASYKFHGRDMSEILFFIFASCHPLSHLQLVPCRPKVYTQSQRKTSGNSSYIQIYILSMLTIEARWFRPLYFSWWENLSLVRKIFTNWTTPGEPHAFNIPKRTGRKNSRTFWFVKFIISLTYYVKWLHTITMQTQTRIHTSFLFVTVYVLTSNKRYFPNHWFPIQLSVVLSL